MLRKYGRRLTETEVSEHVTKYGLRVKTGGYLSGSQPSLSVSGSAARALLAEDEMGYTAP